MDCDHEYQTWEERILEQYLSDPKAFSEKRDEVYCFSYVPSGTKAVNDKWSLVDTDRGVVCTVFDTPEQLTEFLKPNRVKRAIKRIMMDRIVSREPDRSTLYAMEKCLDLNTICLIKDCVSAMPRDFEYACFDDEYTDNPIEWRIINNTAAREEELCAELYHAGIENDKTLDAIMPY
jgi:hypothetical protein